MTCCISDGSLVVDPILLLGIPPNLGFVWKGTSNFCGLSSISLQKTCHEFGDCWYTPFSGTASHITFVAYISHYISIRFHKCGYTTCFILYNVVKTIINHSQSSPFVSGWYICKNHQEWRGNVTMSQRSQHGRWDIFLSLSGRMSRIQLENIQLELHEKTWPFCGDFWMVASCPSGS